MHRSFPRKPALLGVLALGVLAPCAAESVTAETTPASAAAVVGSMATPPASSVGGVVVAESAPLQFVPMRTIPEPTPPPTAAEALEQRLEALAREVEAQHRRAPTPGLVEFDVEGLAAGLGGMLMRYQDRASVSVHVRDLVTGHVLFDYFGDTPLIPASNQKILTSSAALDLLGHDYVFTTDVSREGSTLYLRGGGDPLLLAQDLEAVADLVVDKTDLAQLQRLVIDDTAFSRRRFGPGYDSDGPGHAYQAPSGALSLSFNTVEITVYPIHGSRTLGVSLQPEGAHVRVDNRATVGRRDTLSVRTRADGEHTVVELRGSLPRGGHPVHVRRRIFYPGLFTGHAFARMLAERGTGLPLPVERGVVPDTAEVLVINESLPLFEVIDSGMAYSNNFIAEQILRTLAWRMTGDPGDWNAGQRILHDYWEVLTGPQHEMVVENASGLSRQARLTTQGLVDLIAIANRTAPDVPNLIDVLPVAGEEGTMRSRLRLSGKRIRAKTGTLDGVSGLSGVITTEAGDPLIGFSILTNVDEESRLVADYRRALEDRIVMAVVSALDRYEAAQIGMMDAHG